MEDVTRFEFDESKAAAAAELLDDGATDYVRLLKLLYIAEGRALERWGWAP